MEKYSCPIIFLTILFSHLHFTLTCVHFTTDMDGEFETMRWCNGFVDKSLFLEEFLNRPRTFYVTAPSRFGKTTLLSMTRTFYGAVYHVVEGKFKENEPDHNETLTMFKDLRIYKGRRYFFDQNFKKYVVININFSRLIGITDHRTFQIRLCLIIKSMLQPYRYLLDATDVPEEDKKFIRDHLQNPSYCFNNFKSALRSPRTLAKILFKLSRKPVIVVGDEFDTIIVAHIKRNIDEEESSTIQTEVGEFVRSVGKLEDSQLIGLDIEKVFFTGILNLGGLVSALISTMIHTDFFHDEAIAKYYGLSEDEVVELLKKFNQTYQYNDLKAEFDGYSVIGSKLKLLNIPTVVASIQQKQPVRFLGKQAYSANEELWTSFQSIFLDYRVGSTVLKSIQAYYSVCGKSFRIENLHGVNFKDILDLRNAINNHAPEATFLTSYQTNIFFTYLVECGIYTVLNETDDYRWIKATNMETKDLLAEYLLHSGYSDKSFNTHEVRAINLEDAILNLAPNKESIERLGDAIYMLFEGNSSVSEANHKDTIIAHFRKAAMESPHRFSSRPKVQMHMPNETEAITLDSTKTGAGRIDLIFITLKDGTVLIIEFKSVKGGAAALNQIFKKRYCEIKETHPYFKQYSFKTTILLGMSFSEKGRLTMHCMINQSNFTGEFFTYSRSPKFTRQRKRKTFTTTIKPKK